MGARRGPAASVNSHGANPSIQEFNAPGESRERFFWSGQLLDASANHLLSLCVPPGRPGGPNGFEWNEKAKGRSLCPKGRREGVWQLSTASEPPDHANFASAPAGAPDGMESEISVL